MKTNRSIKYFGGLFAALLFAAVNAFATVHITSQEANDSYWVHYNSGHSAPDVLVAAMFYGSGVTLYDDGTYVLDVDNIGRYQAIAQETYNTVLAGSGDPLLAIEAAIGLLSPAELAEAQEAAAIRAGGGAFHYINWFSSPFGYYPAPAGGGGGGLLY